MDRLILAAVLIVLVMALIRLTFSLRRAAAIRGQTRAACLDDCKPLLEAPIHRLSPSGFPRLSGRYQGLTVDIQTVSDALSFRKLPALWLLVSVVEPQPIRATLDIMARPSGLEPFSHFNQLPQEISPPPGFPADCAIRTDDASAMPPLDTLEPHLQTLTDPRAKELLIAPKGLRLVWLAEEADRTRFLIFREAELAQTPVDANRVATLLDRLVALHHDLAATPSKAKVA